MSKVEEKALWFIREFKVKRCPVDVQSIAEKQGWNILPYDSAAHIINDMGLQKYISLHPSVAIIYDATKYILYDEKTSPENRQNLIAHELGHYYIDYEGSDKIMSETQAERDAEQAEQDADQFMRFVRAPLAYLSTQDIKSAADLEQRTGLDRSSARLAYQELADYKDSAARVGAIQQTQRQFNGTFFIEWVRRHRGILSALATLIVAVGVFGTILALQTPDQPITPDAPVSDKQSIPDQVPSEPQNQTPAETNDTSAAHSIPDESDPDDDPPAGTVYWTDAGRVYHLYDDCQHIKNSIQVFSGPESMAEDEGKKDVCKTCLSRSMSSK